MRSTFVLPLAAAFLALAAGTAFAGGGIKLDEAWARATPGAVKTGAIYLTITNTGTAPDTLEGASTPAAATASLHQMKMVNGVMEMRPVQALTIAPGKSVVLAPGGYHIMLEGLKAPLKEGQTVPLTLTFAHAGSERVTAAIAKVGAMHAGEMSNAMSHSAGSGMSGGSGMSDMPNMH